MYTVYADLGLATHIAFWEFSWFREKKSHNAIRVANPKLIMEVCIRFNFLWVLYIIIFQESLGSVLHQDDMMELMEVFEKADVDDGKNIDLKWPADM